MKPSALITLLILFLSFTFRAQELNCQVAINTDQVQGTTNKQIFDQLQKAIYEFMNTTKWTADNFASQERIDCSVLIIIKQANGADEYSGTIQIQSAKREA